MIYRNKISSWGLKKLHIRILILFAILALFHPFIANDKYIAAISDDGLELLASPSAGTQGIRTLVPYSEKSIDKKNRNVGPFSKQDISSVYYRHWLGTDDIGRDVLAGIIYGTAVAFKVGVTTTIIVLIVGILFGFLSGYIGDYTIRLSLSVFIILLTISALGIFYWYYTVGYIRWLFLLVPLLLLIGHIRFNNSNIRQGIAIPFDIIILRIIEIINSIPGMFLLLVLLAFFSTPSIWNVVLVISFLRWPNITRHLRAEILKLKNEDFIVSAKASGLSHFTIFTKYILPLAISPIIILSAFGFANAILLESSLSFLGIGIPLDQVSWGSLLRDARLNISSWWLAVFPGAMIYISIMLFNSIGDAMTDKLQKVNK
jgi:peptide/nickel transport system permease protein